MKKLKYLFLLLVFIPFFKVHAIGSDFTYTINGRSIVSPNSYYTPANMSMALNITEKDTSTPDRNAPTYGKVELCSALGSYNDRLINSVTTWNASISEVKVYNTNETCTISSDSAYITTARKFVVTFKIQASLYNYGNGNGVVWFNKPLQLAWYTKGSNVYEFISFNYGYEPFTYKADLSGIAIANNINQTNQNITNLNQDITNDNVDQSKDKAGGFFNNFQNNNHGLTGIITSPLNLIKSLTSKSCTPLNLQLPFVNQPLILPCMREIYESKFSGIYEIYKIVVTGFVGYYIAVNIFAMVKGFKDPDKDEVEVMEL